MTPKVILFDVFGTVVDWRGSLIRELNAFGALRGVQADWPALVDAWRGAYAPELAKVLKGEAPWRKLEAIQRASLEGLVEAQAIEGLTGADLDEINSYWRRCRPWRDSVAGLRRLRRRFVIAPLSNGDMALLVEMARRGGLPWDAVISTELFHSFKPHPSNYLGACDLLGVAPAEAMMAAAHPADLKAARAQGLATAFVWRPREYGRKPRPRPQGDWDLSVDSLTELASRLEA